MIDVYRYDREGYYMGIEKAQPSPVNGALIMPTDCAREAPPQVHLKPNEAFKYDRDARQWRPSPILKNSHLWLHQEVNAKTSIIELLRQTDWTQLEDAPLPRAEKMKAAALRKELRTLKENRFWPFIDFKQYWLRASEFEEF